jgi:hypothetical protein
MSNYIVGNGGGFLNKRDALERAYALNLTVVYDTINNVDIKLPTKQRSGTQTQQKAYITSVIDRLCSGQNK